MADEIRRRAQREADQVRRAAAEWASDTRREIEEHRRRVMSELDRERLALEAERAEVEAAAADQADGPPRDGLGGDVIDLRPVVERTPVPPEPERPTMEPVGAGSERGPRQTPVQGPEDRIDTRISDAVRQRVRRTFLGPEGSTRG
jgi:hypothetical protein